MRKTWRIAGINFQHLHMGELLRQAHVHPNAEIVGICDEQPERMDAAIAAYGIPGERVFTDYRRCMEASKPDIVILCPSTAEHGLWTERIAPYGTHIVMEKPFAMTLQQADAMIEAVSATGKQLVINWPLAWYPPYITTKRLIDEGAIGDVLQVHTYGGNRGPLWHSGEEIVGAPTVAQKNANWFYHKDAGGGSLHDYLGYGTTLGTWFMGGRKPIEVTCMMDVPAGLEVDEHSIVIARYATGLSKFETRWGTFSDPWIHQPEPKCGMIVVGSEGAIAAYDYDQTVRLQNGTHPEGTDLPVDVLSDTMKGPIAHMIDAFETDRAITGPISTATSRIGQQIVETAIESAELGCTRPLVD